MDQQRIQELITLFVSGEISPEEQAEFSQLIERRPEVQEELNDALAVWNLLGSEDVSFSPHQVFAWEKIQDQMESPSEVVEEEAKRIIPFTPRTMIAVAAAVVLLVVSSLFIWSGDKDNEVLVPEIASVEPAPSENDELVYMTEEESQSFYLPDSSLVQLNKNSTLTVTEVFADGARVIYLSGEAFFDVKHDEDHPFIVLTEHTRTKVLGTSFKVRAYPEESRKIVRVESGIVLFKGLDERIEDSLYLYKSDQGVYDLNISSLVKEPGSKKSPRLLGGRSKAEIIKEEKRYPARYLKTDFNVKAKVIAPSVIRVEITNEAKHVSYSDILITVKYEGKKGDREANFTVEDAIKPGDRLKSRFKLKDWFKKSRVLDVTIRNAEGFSE